MSAGSPQNSRDRRELGGRLGPWGLAVPLVAAVAGGIFAASAATARGEDLRGGERSDLRELIQLEERRVDGLEAHVAELRAETRAMSDVVSERDEGVASAQLRADEIAPAAGLTAVEGPGVTVRLDDAPRMARDRAEGGIRDGGPSPDDLVVHQQDVQAVVNALWVGGAEAMQIMDQRVISTSAVRCVGNTLILQGRVYSPPFSITAIGDPAEMQRALDADAGVKIYRQYVKEFQLGYKLDVHRAVALPAYDGSLDLEYAGAESETARR
jgi:uncharacterized protein YlxW (UPF0749 family)